VLALSPRAMAATQCRRRQLSQLQSLSFSRRVSAQKAGRVVVLVAPDDKYHPDRGVGSGFGAQLRGALPPTGRPYVVFDESGPIHGHAAGTTNQFSTWFDGCVLRFLDSTLAVAAGETGCKAPNPVPHYLLPADLKRPTPGNNGPARLLGARKGPFDQSKRDVMIVVETATADIATVVYAPSGGSANDANIATATRARK
jgi:hypothetical protein